MKRSVGFLHKGTAAKVVGDDTSGMVGSKSESRHCTTFLVDARHLGAQYWPMGKVESFAYRPTKASVTSSVPPRKPAAKQQQQPQQPEPSPNLLKQGQAEALRRELAGEQQAPPQAAGSAADPAPAKPAAPAQPSAAGHLFLITNAHCVMSLQHGQNKGFGVLMESGDRGSASVLGCDRDADIAVLQPQWKGDAAAVRDRLRPLRVREKPARAGEEVGIVGFPSTLPLTFSRGTVAWVGHNMDRTHAASQRRDLRRLQVGISSASTCGGSSGSPVFDSRGQVLSVNYGSTLIGGATGGKWRVGTGASQLRDAARSILEHGCVVRPRVGLSVELLPCAGSSMQRPAGSPAWLKEKEVLLPEAYSWALAVRHVQPYSSARRAGLQGGDLVVAVDGQPVRHRGDLVKALGYAFRQEEAAPPPLVELSVLRLAPAPAVRAAVAAEDGARGELPLWKPVVATRPPDTAATASAAASTAAATGGPSEGPEVAVQAAAGDGGGKEKVDKKAKKKAKEPPSYGYWLETVLVEVEPGEDTTPRGASIGQNHILMQV